MKNKTTYEMDDIMGLITRDLEEKGLEPDPASVEIWVRVDGVRVKVTEIEIEANVSWVGIPSTTRLRNRRVAEFQSNVEAQSGSQDLLDEAPRPGGGPVLEIGIDEVVAASTGLARSGGEGPFSPDRVKRRLADNESTDYPGTTPRGR